ncbi:uncharacterized protein PV09_05086 [Verruconis gallopava]|uniref:Uncharacterized protein n=1 Tax=Verruconis gallopava TaxID=253628 RepID=A0A0D2AAI1_9PEZI|nr:uncharacterized protein PV09_05086 [Verruconis gallopava]KIW03783.1 hypothetical protein PV09_05086 [Verruconis gallopava]
MPHKHKRRKTSDDAAFDLPPTTLAKALPVKNATAKPTEGKHHISQQKKKKNKEQAYQDDTPRAFKQLMQLRKTGKGYKGLDDGPQKRQAQQKAGDKRKRNQDDQEPEDRPSEEAESKPELKIRPGERLSDYAARVDRALPVAGLITKNNKVEGMREQRKTRHEKKLQRLVNNWKAEEARRIEKAEEEWDEVEEEIDEQKAMWEAHAPTSRKKAKRKGNDDDPWAELKKKRDKPKGVFDVAQAPPQFTKVPKAFKIRDGAGVKVDNVPNVGSLRRQEILSETRQDVINRYRQMMQAKRGEA